jgi:hypothetical protein
LIQHDKYHPRQPQNVRHSYSRVMGQCKQIPYHPTVKAQSIRHRNLNFSRPAGAEILFSLHFAVFE